ncbi:ATP-binding protein [uncultured Bacteroides sp.]|uniref:ATP-binding protein n=1 Tax=uncultured Bacteroides sp. TaxID=162156 RepID=UPI002AAB6E9D|nr:ATP-binding protein [uncultured Bacteroides sp.]
MKRKELLKQLIVTYQETLSMEVEQRGVELPLHTGKIITVTGVRRCGKSCLFTLAIKQLLVEGVDRRKILFLNFDDERLQFDREGFDEILDAYRELYADIPMNEVYIFFDEIQMADSWEQFVRRVYDQETRNLFITGSNSKMLSSEIATSLRGRTLQFEVFPLSFKEFCIFRKVDTNYYVATNRAPLLNLFYDYLRYGAFPEVVMGDSRFREQMLQEYFFVMLYKDLVERYNIRNPAPVRYFIKRILANITKPTSINKLYNELKSQGVTVGKNTLYELIEQIEAIYLLLPLTKYDPSLVKENSADNKYYCIDNGLRGALLASHGEDNGALLENLVYLYLRRSLPFGRGLFYFKGKRECDFLITDKQEVSSLIQVSWDISEPETKKREIDGLLEAATATGCSRLLIITAEAEEEITIGNMKIEILPAWKWMLESL